MCEEKCTKAVHHSNLMEYNDLCCIKNPNFGPIWRWCIFCKDFIEAERKSNEHVMLSACD